jgi:type I restriction enzyme S subunit
MSEWKKYKFSELCDVTRGASPRPIKDFISNEGMPWVKIADATSGESRFIEQTKERIKLEGVEKSKSVFSGDLILSNSATPGLPKFMKIEACIHDGWMLLRNFRGLNKRFAYWLLLHERKNLVMCGNGSVFVNLKTDILKDHEVIIPDEVEQERIADILDSIAEKIELNHQINQTLESILQAIFKSWFVDFEPVKAKISAIEAGEDSEGITRAAMSAISGRADEELDQLQAEQPEHYIQLKTTAELFPAAMQNSELGEVPEGWESKAFSKVIDVNPTRRLSKGKLATKVSMGDLNTWQSWIDSWQKEEYKSGPKFKNGDTLFARITPSLENGKTAFVNFLSAGETAYGSTEFIVFGPKIIASGSYIFCLSRSEHIRETAINAMTGTSGRQRVPNDLFDHMLICVPPDKIVGKFNEITVYLFRMIEHNSKESINLKKARDTLLPKLLSGELSVDATKLAEERG